MHNKLFKGSSILIAVVIMIFSIAPLSILAGAAEPFIQSKSTSVSLWISEIPIEKNQIAISTGDMTLAASDNSYNANGASVINGLSAYSETTMEGILNEPAKDFYKNAAGIDVSMVAATSWGEIFNDTPAELKELIEKYSTTQTSKAYNSFSSLLLKSEYNSSNENYNPVEEMVDFSLELLMSSVLSDVPEYSGLIDLANNSTSMSDMLTDPVQNAGFVSALAITSGTQPSKVNDTPIEELFVKTLNNIDPKDNGEEYTDVIDAIVYILKDDCNTEVTKTTKVSECVGKIIRADGEFVPRENFPSYPTVFWLEGKPNDKRTLSINITWPDYDYLKDNVYITFDNEPINESYVSLSNNTENGESTITISDIFKNSGTHFLFINIAGSPMYFYLDLESDPPPTSSNPVTTDSSQLPTKKNPNVTSASGAETTVLPISIINNSPDIPKTGYKLIPCVSVMIISGIVAAIVISQKGKRE